MLLTDLEDLALRYHAFIKSDKTSFRRSARIMQSIWREELGLPIGFHQGNPLGSRLPIDRAKERLENYFTPNIRKVVRNEINNAQKGALFSSPRIYNDLLSSQPLCFNLFAELKLDLNLATRIFRFLRPGIIRSILDISFEYSPGRGEEKYTGDRSAFDVFIRYSCRNGDEGFLGLEVKYHENMGVKEDPHRDRYDDIAEQLGWFHKNKIPHLRHPPLQQIWRDHLLAGAILLEDEYKDGYFVFVYPAANNHCRRALIDYRNCLQDNSSFDAWTLEEIVAIIKYHTDGEWIKDFYSRYLDFEKILAA